MLSSTLLGCHSLLPLWTPCCINHLQNTACVKPLAHSSDSATDYSNCSLSFWQLNASTLPTTLWSSLLPLSQAGREEPLLNFLVMPVALLLVHSWWPRWMMCPLGLYLESSPGSTSLLKYIHSSILSSLNLFVPASAIFQGSMGISTLLRVTVVFLRLLCATPTQSVPIPGCRSWLRCCIKSHAWVSPS